MPRIIALSLALLSVVASTSVAQAFDVRLWDVQAKQETALAEAAKVIPQGALVTMGEQHDDFGHHMAQLEMIKALYDTGRPLAVGLEMFQYMAQDILNAWVMGKLSERDMIDAFRDNWGDMWPLYRPIFEFCREQRIPMIGLNVPRAITRQVARRGFSSLTPEQVGELPPVACILDPEYEVQLRRLLGPHGAEGNFERFCEAQMVWDTAMAFYSLEYLKAHPRATVAVVCGYVHAWNKAIPAQVRRLAPDTPTRAILPSITGRIDPQNVRSGDANYLFLGLE